MRKQPGRDSFETLKEHLGMHRPARGRVRKHAPDTQPHQRQGDRASGDDGDAPAPPRRFLTGPDLCRRYSVSDMTIWRWLHDADLAFPQPDLIVRGRRFWAEESLRAFEKSRIPPDRSREVTAA
jgi:predicted DNA-binding transcriptional regulator AlpA